MPGVPHVGQRVEAKTDGNGLQSGTILAAPVGGKCKVRFDINGQAYDVPLNLLRPAQGAAAAAPAQQQAPQQAQAAPPAAAGAPRIALGARVDAATDGHGVQSGVIVGAPQPNGNIKIKFDINGQSYDVPMRLLRASKQLPQTMASQPGPSTVSSRQMDRWLEDSDDDGMGGKNGRKFSSGTNRHPHAKNAKGMLHEWCQKHAHLIDAGTKITFTETDRSETQSVIEVELYLRKTRFAFTAAGEGKEQKVRKKNAKRAASELMLRKLTGDPQIVALCRQFPPKNNGKIKKGTIVMAVKQIAHHEGGFMVNPGDKGLVVTAHETGGKYTVQWDKNSNYTVPAFYDQIQPPPRKKKGRKKKKKKKTTHSGGFGKAGKARKKKVKTRGMAIQKRSGKKFHEGQAVLVKVKGKWMDGKIEELESNGKYCVYVQAADNHVTVSSSRIKTRKMNDWGSSMYEDVNESGPPKGAFGGSGGMFAAPWAQSKVFSEGQTVYAKWKNKSEFPGVVDSINGDGTYRIYWPKWKNHSNCPAKDIRPRKGSKSSGMDAFNPY